MVCNHCGAPLEPGMGVCPHCGYTSDSDGKSPERTATHRPHEGRTNTRNREAFMAATSASRQSTDRAVPVRADGNPCLFCGTIIPENAINCPKCGRAVSGKAPSISGAMPPVPKTPRQAYEARATQGHTRASVAATAAYAAMAQKMGYNPGPRQITGEIPPVSQTSGKIPPVSQNSGKIAKVPQTSGAIPPISQGSGSIPPVPQTSGKIPSVPQTSGKIPPVSQNSGKIPPIAGSFVSADKTASLGSPLSEDAFIVSETPASNTPAEVTAVLPPLAADLTSEAHDVSEVTSSQDSSANTSDKNPYAGAHAKPAAVSVDGSAAKKHPTKAKTPLSTSRQQTIGVAPITSRDLTNEQQRSKRKSVIGIGIITCVLAAGVGIGAWWFNGGDEKQQLIDYIETLGSFNNQDNNNTSDSPFAPNEHTSTGGTSVKSLDDNTSNDNKDTASKTPSSNNSKTTTTKNNATSKDETGTSTNSSNKTTVTDNTAKNTTTPNNQTQSSSNTNTTNNANTTSNTQTNTSSSGTATNSNSSSNSGGYQGSTGSNGSGSTSIWPDDLNNPPYEYNPPAPGNSGGSGSWGTGSWGGGSSGGNGGNGSYYPPLSDLETEADKELRRELDKAKARVEDYILPESNDRDYLREELNKLSDFELYLARNEIYARHGRIFNVAALDEYFNSRTWYFGKYTGVVFDTMVNVLNEFEIRNAELIKEIERERNSPYLSE